MIIVKMIGGLGNQLFQHALGRHLAEKNGVGLKLDISGFDTYKLHRYSLRAFNIKQEFATPDEVEALTLSKRAIERHTIGRFLRRPPEPAPTYVKEKHFHFDPEVLNLPDNVYLDGYWQSEKYFKDIETIIRNEFVLKMPQEGKNKELAETIRSCESVSLHIRRGDYVANPETNRVLGLCGIGYYLRCIEEIAKKARKPHFFVFSDEPGWARENLKIGYPATFVDHNGPDKNYEDLRLMSQCRRHIIANSTFSWWGAWLNPDPDKLVIAPKRWFRTDEHRDTDLIPENWLRI